MIPTQADALIHSRVPRKQISFALAEASAGPLISKGSVDLFYIRQEVTWVDFGSANRPRGLADTDTHEDSHAHAHTHKYM